MIDRTISHYRIDAEIGRGGMGVVYRATDLSLNRPVAIKFLSSEVATEERRRRFQQEAQTASSLNHPHILTVFEAGTIDGEQYLVTEFIDGWTLREWSRRETRSIRQIVELAITIADALACAHQAGIMHRDIKPENILISKDGYAKLVDFGLAKLLDSGDGQTTATRTMDAAVETRAGVVVGTIPYMSPEQIGSKAVDARSDIFSFGVVLYEQLAGHRPFGGESDPQLIHEIRHGAPRPLLEMRTDAPYGLAMAVEKALEKEPAERYQAMREMVVDLKRVQRVPSSDAARLAVPPSQQIPGNQRRRWWVGIAAVAVALGAGAAVGWLARGTSGVPDNPLANAQFTRFTNFEGDEHDADISRDGKFIAFRANRDGPFDVWLSQIGSGQFVNLTKGVDDELRTSVRSTGFSADGSEIWLGGAAFGVRRARLIPMMGGAPRVFLREGAVTASWSPDGTRIVYHTGYPGDPIFVADNNGANAVQIFINPIPGGHAHFPTWSADGRSIYFVAGASDNHQLDLWRIAASGGTAERLTHHDNDVRYPTPIDRRTLLYVSPETDGSGPWLWALDLERKTTRRVSFGLEKYISVAATADGKRLVATVSNPSAGLWSVPILDRVANEGDVKAVQTPNTRAWLPRYGGASLFYLSSQGAGDGLWRYQDGQSFEVWKGSNGPLLEPAGVSPDGRRAAVVLRRGGKRRLHLVSADGAELQPMTETIDAQGAASWSPDGKWVVTGGSDGKGPGLFKIPTEGGAPVRITTGPALNPVWSPDGDVIVYSSATVALYATLRAVHPDGAPVELPAIQIRGSDGERARFLPRGKTLVYMQGQLLSQDFWMLDLATKKTRPLTHLNNTAAMRTFDVTPDGKQIVFDRLRENSDIVLIDLKR